VIFTSFRPYVIKPFRSIIVKEKTRAAMEWLQNQVDKAKGSDGMTTIKLSKNGRLSEDTIADAFRKARFDVKFGDGVLYCSPYGKNS
jgi:hypothetical protein